MSPPIEVIAIIKAQAREIRPREIPSPSPSKPPSIPTSFATVADGIVKGQGLTLHQVVELLTALASAVHAHEPGCLKYHLHRRIRNVEAKHGEEGRLGEELVMVETYKDAAAYEQHRQSADFKGLVEKIQGEELLAVGLEIRCLEPMAGFASRL